MANVLVNSQTERDEVDSLLKKKVPAYRQAYSDRTAWVMACLSELAYIKFNPIFSADKQKSYFLENIEKLVDENRKSSLLRLIGLVGYDHEEEKAKLRNELSELKMQLIASFDHEGTQAILVSFNDFIVLAFRGTETTSIKDIKADAEAVTVPCETGGKMHAGFKKAYEHVALKIQDKLNEEDCRNKPLFITGHSLGGALATVAAKKLSHRAGLAACYTFGSPRVGDEDWVAKIKTPNYRLVNAADCVTMLPPGAEIVTVISWVFQFVPGFGKAIRAWLLSRLGGYLHCGDMRYLTHCPSGQFSGVKLLFAVNMFRRLQGLIIKKVPWKHLLADHSISVYRKKLQIIAMNRNS